MIKNKFIGIGRLGQDVETKNLENGQQLSNFSIAIGEKYKNKQGEVVEETEWVNIVCWGKTSEIAEKYLKKGDLVAVEGKLKTRSWDANDGSKRYATEVVVSEILMLGSKGGNNSEGSPQSNTSTSKPTEDVESDDLPF